MTNKLILEFHPWIWARTTLYEYYCMSWATRLAAEYTRHSPLEARLVGESFELALKMLYILIQGPEAELKFGHNLNALLDDVPSVKQMLRKLWDRDLDYVIDIMEGECHPSQVRYGAGGGKANKDNRVIPSGYAKTSGVWTSPTLTFYEELMSTLGCAIWSNYPEGDRNGQPVKRSIQISPLTETSQGLARMTLEKEIDHEEDRFDPTIWAYILIAENVEATASKIPYWGIIPMERLNDPDGAKFYVRVRISSNVVIDVEVTKNACGLSVGTPRIAGSVDGRYRLNLHGAYAVMPHRGGR